MAMMEFIEHDVHRSIIRADRVLYDRLTGDRDRVTDAWDSAAGGLIVRIVMFAGGFFLFTFTPCDLFNLSHDLLGALERCGIGEANVDEQIAFVL